jgi:hypothetical protein
MNKRGRIISPKKQGLSQTLEAQSNELKRGPVQVQSS